MRRGRITAALKRAGRSAESDAIQEDPMKPLCLALLIALVPFAAMADSLSVSPTSYGAGVADKLKECKLSESQSESVLKALSAAGVPAQAASADAVPAKGRFLQLRIESAMSAGNGFTGHHKQVTTSAHLFENGKEIGQTTVSRDSSGGAFGGYKGSCNVLRRCTVTLGKDIASWVKSQPAPASPAR
jgi:hypothetical protein